MTPTRFDHVWAFDFGTASLGIAVRQGNDIRHAASLRLPEDFASTKAAAVRRRMLRTRQAHKAREARWREIAAEAGIEVLNGRLVKPVEGQWRQVAKGDERLEREFPKKGDETCYTSCLLRIKLLRGDTDLQPWQVFKAVHAVLQHRGYDADIPWKERKTKQKNGEKEDEDKKTQARAEAYVRMLEEMAPGQPNFHHPCYLEALRMGLWEPARPQEFKLRIDHHAERARVDYKNGESVGHVTPRELVRQETRILLEQAASFFPKLKGQTEKIMFGPGEKEYASYFSETRKSAGLRRGAGTDWLGILGQKIPRFDNRILDQCKLIPEYHVCKAAEKKQADGQFDPASLLPAEVVFLLKLKNLRIVRSGEIGSLQPEEIWTIFRDPSKPRLIEALPPPLERDRAIDDAHPAPGEPDKYKLTVAGLKKWCEKLGLRSCPNHEEVAPPNTGGRSRFCRPALAILKRLLLSGQTPAERYLAEVARLNGNKERRKGLVQEQLEFLRRLGETWDGIYVPNERLSQLGSGAETREQRIEAIYELIGSVNNPVVRHRLGLFLTQLKQFERRFNPPDAIAMEFVREDFMGEKAKIKYRKFLKDRETQRKEARQMVETLGAGKSASLKYELLKEQGSICLYTGESLQPTELESLRIEHIVPRSRGGPDAVINYVVTKRETNDEKGNRTPFEWLQGKPGWDAYVERVKSHSSQLRNKKVALLTSPDAVELSEKYTALAETAYIAKLAQTLACLYFGWPRSGENGGKRVIVLSGGLTARVRRKYHLDGLLYGDNLTPEELEKKTKNRADDRHHALDAMVLSFLPGWARNPDKEDFFKFPFPKGEEREFFKQKIAKVVPEWVGREKPVLRETIYGARYDEEGILRHLVHRVPLVKVAYTGENPKYSVAYGLKAAAKIRDLWIQGQIIKFLQNEPDEGSWTEFCANLLHMNGSKISHIALREGDLKQAADLSKDKLKPRSGAWRVRKREHQGQFIYQDEDGKIQILPVLVFESKAKIFQKMLSERKFKKIIGFFRSKDLVEITKPIPLPKGSCILPAGKYLVNTIESDGRAELEAANGETFRVGLTKLIEAGFRPAKKELS